MDRNITRPILWNVPVAFQVLLYALFFVLMGALIVAAIRWYRIIRLGTAENRFDHPARRAWIMIHDAFGQRTVVRESWGWMHYSLYVGFIGLFIGTNIVFINSDIAELSGALGMPFYFFYGAFYHVFKAAMDTFFILVIVGVIAAALRRLIVRPQPLNQPPADKLRDSLENRLGYWFPLTMLVLVAATGLMLE